MISAQFSLTGVISAPYTPMHEDGSLDLSKIDEYSIRLKASGIAGVFIGGTTGESFSLTTDERVTLAEAWVKNQADDFHVIAHIGSESLPDILTLSTHAREIGAHGVGLMPPVFFKPGMNELVEICKQAANACDPLPFYFYHIPSMTGVNLSMMELAKRCKAEISNFRGMKFTHNDLVEYSLLADLDNRSLDILYGRDETMLSGLGYGAKGMIGSTFNYAMPIYNELIKAYHVGDMVTAREWQIKSQKMIEILIKYGGGISGGKTFMQVAGLDLGPCRLPNTTITDVEGIKADLKAAGVLQYIKI